MHCANSQFGSVYDPAMARTSTNTGRGSFNSQLGQWPKALSKACQHRVGNTGGPYPF